jgi:ribosomal-protein-alanine N-acetyltransferase
MIGSAPMQVVPRVLVDRMREDDIPAVQTIERAIFLTPWPRNAYHRELSQNRQACYLVLREENGVVGYGGLWKVGDEAHVTTIGVRQGDQGKGYGRALFAALVLRAYTMGARWVTLEVRVTNERAIRLYEAFGFKVIGRRRGYYTDNSEDAVVMWSDSIHSPAFKRRLRGMLDTVREVPGLGDEPPDGYPER